MESHLQALIVYFSAHPHIGLSVVFAASLLESVALIGTLVPGSTLVFAGGVLVGLNAFSLEWAMGAAVAGAILGDGFSYWFGSHYRNKIYSVWPLKHYPALLETGQAYFVDNGGKSLFFGRFLGPVRAIVPVAAGMAGMPAIPFYFINILSALAWAAAHVVPGMIFGASLQLAGAVSGRLVIILLFVALVFWTAFAGVRFVYRRAWPWVDLLCSQFLGAMRARPGHFPRTVLSFFDTSKSELPALLWSATILLGTFAFLRLLSNQRLLALDRNIHAIFFDLRTEWGDKLMVSINEATGSIGLSALVVAVALFFLLTRRWHTLFYWLAAVIFSQLLVWALIYTGNSFHGVQPRFSTDPFYFLSGHAAVCVVLYGLLAVLLTRGKSVQVRMAATFSVSVLIALIALSDLYLGIHGFSSIVMSIGFGFVWVVLLAVAYRNHVLNEPLRTSLLALVVTGVFVLTTLFYVGGRHRSDLLHYAHHAATPTVLSPALWTETAWRTLPIARSELDGDLQEPFSVQWAGTPGQIAAVLTQSAWKTPVPWFSRAALLWLLPDTPIEQLPVLPKFNRGQAQKLTWVRVIGPNERLVIRLWRLPYVIEGSQPRFLPLWHGLVTREDLYHPARAASLVRTKADFYGPVVAFVADIQASSLSMLEKKNRDIRVLLLWPRASIW